jgi:membrane-associated phospholipid phosphatase
MAAWDQPEPTEPPWLGRGPSPARDARSAGVPTGRASGTLGPQRFVVRAAAQLVAAYVVLSAALIAWGLVLTHAMDGVTRWDDGVSRWVAGRRTPPLDALSHWGTFVADTLGISVVAVVVTVLLVVRHGGRLVALVPCGLLIELGAFLTVNYVVQRPRPTVPHLGSTPSTWSFPSGHCAASVVLYGSIAVLVWSRLRARPARAGALVAAVVVPLWVAASRVYAGQHHLLDVLAGLAMGLGVLAATSLAFRAGLAAGGAPARSAARPDRPQGATGGELPPAPPSALPPSRPTRAGLTGSGLTGSGLTGSGLSGSGLTGSGLSGSGLRRSRSTDRPDPIIGARGTEADANGVWVHGERVLDGHSIDAERSRSHDR